MTAFAPKAPDGAIGPGVAASQAEWHCSQAAEHFEASTKNYKSAQSRRTARNRFIADTRHALPSMGLESFLGRFKLCVRERGSFEQAEPIIRELWAELQAKPIVLLQALPAVTAGPIAAGDAVQMALVNAQQLIAIGLQQIEVARRLVQQPQRETATAAIETRSGK